MRGDETGIRSSPAQDEALPVPTGRGCSIACCIPIELLEVPHILGVPVASHFIVFTWPSTNAKLAIPLCRMATKPCRYNWYWPIVGYL